MSLRLFFVAVLLFAARPLLADGPLRGPPRLRELAVFPRCELTWKYNFEFSGREWLIGIRSSLADEISDARAISKRAPTELDPLLHLAYLLGLDHQTNEVRVLHAQAEQMARKKIDLRPQDGLPLVQLGEALEGLGREAETESVLRHAVLVSSNDWRCWSALGRFLEGKANRLITPPNLPPAGAALSSGESTDVRWPSPEAFGSSRDFHQEAGRCIDRATALGQRVPEFWLGQVSYSSLTKSHEMLLEQALERQPITPSWSRSADMLYPVIHSLQKAAALNPNDYNLIALPAYLEWIRTMQEGKAEGATNAKLPDLISDASRRRVLDALAKLEDLAQNKDKMTTAGIWECHGFLALLMGNRASVETDFRRAVALDPAREATWNLWLGTCEDSEREEICEARLKNKNSAVNHLLLGLLLERKRAWEKAREHADAALKLEPGNLVAQIMLVALTIRTSKDFDSLLPAKAQLEQIRDQISKLPPGQEKSDRYREFTLNAILFNALANGSDSAKEGREEIDKVLQLYPNDADARDIRAALE